jgi:hypothetical protein
MFTLYMYTFVNVLKNWSDFIKRYILEIFTLTLLEKFDYTFSTNGY